MDISIFEIIMLICFGCSWPVAIFKTIEVKNPAGKSFLFMGFIIVGYIAGGIHKILYSFDIVFYLYMVNAALVLTDMLLCLYYRRKNAAK